jgi:hypothetical protein
MVTSLLHHSGLGARTRVVWSIRDGRGPVCVLQQARSVTTDSAISGLRQAFGQEKCLFLEGGRRPIYPRKRSSIDHRA